MRVLNLAPKIFYEASPINIFRTLALSRIRAHTLQHSCAASVRAAVVSRYGNVSVPHCGNPSIPRSSAPELLRNSASERPLSRALMLPPLAAFPLYAPTLNHSHALELLRSMRFRTLLLRCHAFALPLFQVTAFPRSNSTAPPCF